MQLKKLILGIFSICLLVSINAQYSPGYPRQYFRNPMGIPMQLSANFGELRPNHWHMGLDIRTNQKENQPVYAAADGYIAHIGIRPGSFGRFLIINHPNGLSTLYAHLNDFYPELEQYVTEQQYKMESWAVEIDPAKELFPLRKGTFIAYSGNTGGSQGPHLHFEIFDTESGKRLNPLLFDFPLADKVPPVISRLAMYDRSRSVYEQSPRILNLKNTDSGYIIPKVPVLQTGLRRISFAIQAHDKLSGGGSPNGIFSAALFRDQEQQIMFILDSIAYEETLYMNAHIDHKHDHGGGVYLQHLSKMPGDQGAVYKPAAGDGVIVLEDTLVHQVAIEVKDAYGNTSVLQFGLQFKDSLANSNATVTGLQKFPPLHSSTLLKPDFEFSVKSGTLYDSVPQLYYRNAPTSVHSVSMVHQVNNDSYPVHGEISVRIKPSKEVPDTWRDRIIIQRSGKGSNVRKAQWEGNWLRASFNDFGSFQAFADIIPPVFNDPGKGDTIDLSAATRILFTPRDNFGVIKRFRAELDGSWLRFTNDKGKNWIYKFDERCPYGVHELTLTVEDLAGNITTKTWWFKRYPYTPPKKKAPVKKKKSSSKKKTSKSKK